jgi:hypothetical protein
VCGDVEDYSRHHDPPGYDIVFLYVLLEKNSLSEVT